MGDIKVRATYSGPLIFLSSGHFNHVLGSLKDRLPLRNLHWKSASRTSIRSVQELSVVVEQLDTTRDETSSQVPTTLLEKPLLNLYFITCDDADMYKNTVRKQIKDWHTLVSQRKNQEWLIVLVSRPDSLATGNRLFQRGSVADKIRADFNIGKRDRCVQLAWSVGSEDPAAWTDLISKMKDGIISSFDAHITLREDEVKRSEIQRQMPGWNFCTFFILKETLALSFEGIGLIEDAELQYDELEASFYQVLKEKNLSWFGQLGGTAANDDSAPLLDVSKKPYRDLILSNTITVFDFRSYLLARQCTLLARMGDIIEAAAKAARFVTSFARTLRENTQSLSELFLESWQYSAAFSIVDQCQQWADVWGIEGEELKGFTAIKGELLQLARSQLDKIGIRAGYLPSIPPFTVTLPFKPDDLPNNQPMRSSRISRADLLEAIASQGAFDRLYIATTSRAIETFISAGRRRFALQLHASLGALEYHRGQHLIAYKTFSRLPSHYADQRWASLEGFMLSKNIESPDAEKDERWLDQALAFLKALVMERGLSHDGFSGKYGSELETFLEKLMEELQQLGQALPQDHIVQSHPALALRLPQGQARNAVDQDGSFIALSIHNHLPCDVPVDEILLEVSGVAQANLTFTALSPLTLLPGANAVSVFCPNPASGLFQVHAAEARIGRILFQFSFPHPSITQNTSKLSFKKAQASLCRLSRDPAAFDVQLGFPRSVILNETPHLLVTISTGRNSIQEATVGFVNPGDLILFDTSSCSLIDDSSVSVEVLPDRVVLANLEPASLIRLSLPYSGASLDQIKVLVQAEYTTSGQPDIVREFERVQTINTALPLAVNVQDYFRGKSLFSRFRISCVNGQRLRIMRARLETRNPSPSLRITSCRRESGKIETVSPMKPAHYLFKVDSSAGEPRQESETLLLMVSYRTLREDLESKVTKAIKTVTEKHPILQKYRAWLWNLIVERILEDEGWADSYSQLAEVHLPKVEPTLWKAAVSRAGLDENMEQQALKAYDEISELLLTADSQQISTAYGEWRVLSIPLDLPFMNIVNCARIDVADALKNPIYAGQPVKATVSIETSFHWGASRSLLPAGEGSSDDDTSRGSDLATYVLRFDVDSDVGGSWLVSGPQRGEYTANDHFTFRTSVTLVPLRHGSLMLPKVNVTPIATPPTDTSTLGDAYPMPEMPSCETYQAHLAKRVDVLPRSARSSYVVTVPYPS